MADQHQADASESEISVDMNAADPAKAVTRRASSDIARGVRDTETDNPKPRSKAEREMFRRMAGLERNLERQFDQRLAAQEAEHQRQLSEMRARLEKISPDRGADDTGDAGHEAAIAALKEQLAAAYERGDSAGSAEITQKMSRLDAQFWAKKAAAAGVTTRETAAATTTTRPAGTQGPTVAGSRFIRANSDWWDDPAFNIEQGAANTIYLELVNKEGFDPKSDETFKEVAKQLKEKFPKLAVYAGRGADPGDDDDGDSDDDADVRDTRQRRQAAAGRFDDRGEAGARNRGTKRTLTAQERKTMRDCRLDPDNDAHVVQFVREAAALEASS